MIAALVSSDWVRMRAEMLPFSSEKRVFIDILGFRLCFLCLMEAPGRNNRLLDGKCCRTLHLGDCLLLPPAYTSSQDFTSASPSMLFGSSPESLLGLLLLGLTVILSGGVYLWVLRYVCVGCCSIAVAREPELLERTE